MIYPMSGSQQIPEDAEYLGANNPTPPMAYRPQPQRADRLGANVPENFGGSYSNGAAPNVR